MNFLHQTLQILESRLQALIEGGTARFFPSYHLRHELVQQLVEAMRDELRPAAGGTFHSPNLFTIFLPEQQAFVFHNQPELVTELTECLRQACQETRIEFPDDLVIKVIPNPEPEIMEPQIVAQFKLLAKDVTSTLSPQASLTTESPTVKAFLIVDGTRIFPLDGKTISIGQNDTNDLVIDKPEIGPTHAQLRLVRGRYRIFDLNSGEGTFVNGDKVGESALSPGDVIRLANTPLVFGCEQDADQDRTQELSQNH